MGLIRKRVSPQFMTANRANSGKSTGPRTEPGKARSSRNAGKHLVLAKVFGRSMKDLGEDPADFEKVRESLRGVFEPRDAFEEMLVEDMAELRWRRQRLLRAESGIQVAKKMKFETDQEVLEEYAQILGRSDGLAGLSESRSEYSRKVETLRGIREMVKLEGFKEEGLKFLETVYGSSPRWEEAKLLQQYREYAREKGTHDVGIEATSRKSFLDRLDAEIASFEEEAQFWRAKEVKAIKAMKESQLLPRRKELEKIIRYEAALERQFERKLQQLVSWRRLDREGTIEKSAGVGASLDERD